MSNLSTSCRDDCHLTLTFLFLLQAIDKLEDLLNGGMQTGQANMFGPREYVAIYT